jgi:NAD(P)-dependent dehydrogenase (short-subunit alcohol dehydrogenase family)
MPTIAVTGATGTLGGAIMTRFAVGEWRVWGCCKTWRDDLKDTIISVVDVTSPSQVRDWLKDVGEIDALVTCAGTNYVSPLASSDPWAWWEVMTVNVLGTMLPIREALHRGVKRIVTIGSIHGCTPTSYPNRSAYTASKGAVAALTQALAVELAPQGIAVNCIAPGHLPKLMSSTEAGQALLNAAKSKTPTGKLTTPQDVAEVVWFLCNDAPGNLTGQIVTVDGGFTINTHPLK